MPQWTESQKQVIASSSKRLICSAAAGSGKTAVMIERIVEQIRAGADPFSFLVITFTNAAAAEMKEKIRKRLAAERKDPVIAAAAEKAGAMEVCTIHSFCQHLIRQEFQAADTDPVFQICTGTQRDMLFTKAFRQACNQLREAQDPDYAAFTGRYEPAEAKEIVSEVWHFIMSLPDPFAWLEKKAEDLPVTVDWEHPWFRTVSQMIHERILSLQTILRRQADLFDEYEKQEAYREVWKKDCAFVEALVRWKNGEKVDPSELNADFGRVPPLRNLNDREIDWKERYQALRKKLKETAGTILTWINPDKDRMSRDFAGIREALRGLVKLTEATHREFEENKKQARVLDFTDLEHKALAVLADQERLASVRSRYQRIFVDECQDISSVQDALIETLAGENNTLFMVGDVKQSIYRFRLANPDLFLKKMEVRGPGEECIFLQENFRSRPEVLETANTVFRDVMRKEAAGLDYRKEDELKPGRTDCPGTVPVCVDLVEPGEGKTRLETVAVQTANRIRETVEAGGYRYKDIVILMPEVSGDGAKLADLLKEQGIPVFFDGKNDVYAQPEIELFRNLLALLDNPHLDLALLTVLVNPPFSFIEEELSLIRLKKTGKDVPFWQAFDAAAGEDSQLGEKCRMAVEKLEHWRFQAKRSRLADFMLYLLEDSNICAVFGARAGGRAAQKNLRNLCLQAEKAADHGVRSMRDFLEYLSEQVSGGELAAAPALGNEDNLVRIMTMHRSKGLQFPVVFCLGLEKGLKGKPGAGQVRLDEKLGVCLRYKKPEWRLARQTAADEIFEWKKSHDLKAEKTCLLYVAMTRAQEKLFLVGTEKDRPLWHMPSGEPRVIAASDYLDLLMPSLLQENKVSTGNSQASKPYKITVFEDIQQESVDNSKDIHSLKQYVETLLSAPSVEGMWKEKSGIGTPENGEHSLKKYSVTALLQDARNRIFLAGGEQTPEEKRTPDYVDRMLTRSSADSLPAFLLTAKQPDGGTARGTAVHRFLSLVDLDAVRKSGAAAEELTAQRDRMVEEKVFSGEEGAWIRPEAAGRFFQSALGQRMLASPEIHREWDFNLYVKDRDMILQGMIDCAFREGDGWILLDYKTDRIRNEADFMEEYRPQLAWYAIALRELTGLPVKECWLYSLSVDKAMRVNRQE